MKGDLELILKDLIRYGLIYRQSTTMLGLRYYTMDNPKQLGIAVNSQQQKK